MRKLKTYKRISYAPAVDIKMQTKLFTIAATVAATAVATISLHLVDQTKNYI